MPATQIAASTSERSTPRNVERTANVGIEVMQLDLSQRRGISIRRKCSAWDRQNGAGDSSSNRRIAPVSLLTRLWVSSLCRIARTGLSIAAIQLVHCAERHGDRRI